MIIGTGVDIVRIERIDENISRRILGARELQEFEQIKDKKTYLASHFVAKEAFFKAIGTGIREYSFTDIEITHDKLGKPLYVFHKDFSFNFAHLSITHDSLAIAQVILEKLHGKIYIAMGSNIGNRLKNIQRACDLLCEFGIDILRKSSIYETKPYGVTDQPDFLNCAIEIDTTLAPHSLLMTLLQIEKLMGRTREKRWGPRIIDLDILLFGNLLYESEDLSIPHYDMLNRQFVILPLLEIGVIDHPVYGDLKRFLKEGEECRMITNKW
ncbi:MAG TPA: 2-amino-4-hydroxy-6-hydroxymethyldihydropteridine diphosphokinase [Pseudothermotoga sp.]|nr:2-amino-4-hydroxy-6-hydroxymethyldihydropteridine diphosphokinase [Pseudothermotoga sp.]HOK83842.1 2-amino-4-hydroxy-6-hydroxymethyldihydropteridine diphosphokinase [Pseudothermotoga sp.]HPP70255.1 2-amino-4-hydroxy-6-hydroxymethyldihydropteridine diphosphokinase [Pseudothermotoga sp.]